MLINRLRRTPYGTASAVRGGVHGGECGCMFRPARQPSGRFVAAAGPRNTMRSAGSCFTVRVELALFFSFGISPWDPLPWIM